MNMRILSTRNVFRTARRFGRGRIVAAWLAFRFLLTGRTGKYRIKN